MDVTIKVSDKIAAEARARGIPVEIYVQEILNNQSLVALGGNNREQVIAAIDRIFELRKGNKLEGLRTTDLIREGRKR